MIKYNNSKRTEYAKIYKSIKEDIKRLKKEGKIKK